MEWLERMNRAMDYIEDHLDGTIDYGKIAREACCSTYHFQRMFSFIVDVPLAEYIRRRRMTLAAFELQNSKIKIVDLALKYGYDSPVSFARAFQSLHGVSPSSARTSGVALKAYQRLSFHLSIKGDVAMDYKVVEEGEMCLFGRSIEISYHETNQYERIKAFIAQSAANGVFQSIMDAAEPENVEVRVDVPLAAGERNVLGICASYASEKEGHFHFMIAAECPKNGAPDSFEILHVPKSLWVVFTLTSSTMLEQETVTSIWKRLPEWFQASCYQHRGGLPEIEKRFRGLEGYVAEVWIPVEKEGHN